MKGARSNEEELGARRHARLRFALASGSKKMQAWHGSDACGAFLY